MVTDQEKAKKKLLLEKKLIWRLLNKLYRKIGENRYIYFFVVLKYPKIISKK